jgi:hypothetical protein
MLVLDVVQLAGVNMTYVKHRGTPDGYSQPCMSLNFAITETKRNVLFYSALIFLLQILAPTFQAVMAKPVAGYTDTLCTMYGQVTVFVKLAADQQPDNSGCHECPVCIIQGNLNAQPVVHDLQHDSCYLSDQSSLSWHRYLVDKPAPLVNFLSRAPPV